MKNKSSGLFKAAGIIGIVLVAFSVLTILVSVAIIQSIPNDLSDLNVQGDNLSEDTLQAFKTIFTVVLLVIGLGVSIPFLVGSIKMLQYSGLSDGDVRQRAVLAWSIVLLIFGLGGIVSAIPGILGIVGYSKLPK